MCPWTSSEHRVTHTGMRENHPLHIPFWTLSFKHHLSASLVHVRHIQYCKYSVCSRLRCSLKVLSHQFLCHIQQTSVLLLLNLGLFWLIYCACMHMHTPFRSQTTLNIGSSDLFTVNHVGCLCAAAGMKLTCLATTYLDWWWSRFCMGMPPNAATATMILCTTLQWDEQQQCV